MNPITITSGGNEAFVRFESDTESQRKGFKATYRTVRSSKLIPKLKYCNIVPNTVF